MMDRITPLTLSFLFYTVIGVLNYRVIRCPATLRVHGKEKEYRDFYGQHISLVHSWLTVLISLYVYVLEGGVSYNGPTNQMHIIVLAHSLGYFMYDTLYAEYFSVHDVTMRLHHVMSLFGGFTFYFSSTGGSAAIVSLFLGELSNPWIMKRHIMRTKGQEHYLSYTVYEYTFAISFLVIRSVAATFININMWASTITVIAKVNVSALCGIGLFWCFVILAMLHKKLKRDCKEPTMSMEMLEWIVKNFKHHQTLFIIGLVIVAGVAPIVLTQYFNIGFVNIKVGNTVLL